MSNNYWIYDFNDSRSQFFLIFVVFFARSQCFFVVSLKSTSSGEFKTKKFFFEFRFFEELLRIEILCEHGIFGMNLFPFSVIFLQIKILSIKIVFQINISCHKMKQLCVAKRLKAIKKRLVLVS